ncbi:MAG TPA: methylated-DNA--[protein]-cysteine S-methyltransferase [Acidobacteriota bacterium]|nr:methylated-DNA--[protein]-cysteine S-methyltransferase [Acidobacteriota bacterium]
MTRFSWIDSPVGRLLGVIDSAGLRMLEFEGPRCDAIGDDWIEDAEALSDVERQLAEYFAGERRTFSLPLALQGSVFQQRVWEQLQRIDYGATISYGELARRIGDPKAARAVGLANGANPIAIIIPCHRVIGSDGSLTGYGGGLERKRQLLELEGARITQPTLFG